MTVFFQKLTNEKNTHSHEKKFFKKIKKNKKNFKKTIDK